MHNTRYQALHRRPIEIELIRWSLVLIFAFFGYAKWFPYEAQALVPLIRNSPLLFWMHSAFGVAGASYVLGAAEWFIGIGLAIGTWAPRISALAATGSVITFLTTLTLIFSTPNAWEVSAGGFPAMSGNTSFLLKDLVLMAASLLLLKNSYSLLITPPSKKPHTLKCNDFSSH
ncbi:DUF417 family protein [Pseudomonas carnis]|uniref:YkgB family protein n=1 Tax=Pseudomonas carnis TaxID=2487355 RepID=UPI0018E5DC97|nr:DUF417 family protein [Pseudomonas carnis]MBI6655492.1 DUF417 family protein [Pseudomonas carnis]MBI6661599.1 DUF417 family protein [Pseudomonas carnis]MBI6687344.1 DUF417 family protein [Pseudomonas carnis]